MPERFVIEQARSDADIDRVAALEAACFTNPWTRDMLARELAENPLARVYVLRTPRDPVAAFCTCWVVLDELHINTIAVTAERRHDGLATALMRHVMAEAAAQGARRATLEVRESNAPARGLYERLGFTPGGVRRGYYTHPDEDAIILWKDQLEPAPPASAVRATPAEPDA